MHLNTKNRPHCRLHRLGIENIHSVRSGENGVNAEPVRNPQNSPEIARVAYGIKAEIQSLAWKQPGNAVLTVHINVLRFSYHRKHRGGRRKR